MFLSLNELSFIFQSSTATAGKLLFRCLSAHLHLGLFDELGNLLDSHKFGISLVGGENPVSMAILERELIRLKGEAVHERYNVQEMLGKQMDKNSAFTFIDLSRHHSECSRTDLVEVRSCPVSERGGRLFANRVERCIESTWLCQGLLRRLCAEASRAGHVAGDGTAVCQRGQPNR